MPIDSEYDSMNPEIKKLLAEMHTWDSKIGTSASVQTTNLANVLALISEEQTTAAERMEQQTDRLIKQTDVLVAITKRLHWFTVAMFLVGLAQITLAFVFALKR